MVSRICEHCEFYDNKTEQPNIRSESMQKQIGFCRKRAPIASTTVIQPFARSAKQGVARSAPITIWPSVMHSEWCGEFSHVT